MASSQENRLIAVDTPLGKDVLLLQGLTGREGLSQMFNPWFAFSLNAFQMGVEAQSAPEANRNKIGRAHV